MPLSWTYHSNSLGTSHIMYTKIAGRQCLGMRPKLTLSMDVQLGSHTRQDLSQFSRICSYVRTPVEPELYRDIHLNFSRWYTMTGQDKFGISDESDTTLDNSSDESSDESYSSMPTQEEAQPGSLPLLLNTLDQRPDLRNLVRSVTLDWEGEETYSKTRKASTMMEQAVIRLLRHFPILDRFVT